MVSLYNKIRDKRIVIWGVGILQTDLEGLYDFPRFLYYIDDQVSEKKRISAKQELIYPPHKLADENRDGLMVIFCGEAQDDDIAFLKSMGYGREHYILGQELLFDAMLYEQIHGKETYIWGTGGSYFYKETEIRKYLPNLAGFIVTEKQEEWFQGRKVLSREEAEKQCLHSFIVVASIYYKEIYADLMKMGFRPGKDFLHLETMSMLGDLSAGLNVGYQFDNRSQGRKDLLVVLAGYKEFVWEEVFTRLYTYVLENIDVCIVTSGLMQDQLRSMCQEHQWSYLSTERNNVSLAVNLAIWLHPEAEYIYKMDEDIFVTDGVFDVLKFTYQQVEEDGRYTVGFVAPLVPVNGYGYVRLLELFHLVDQWECRFGSLKYSDCFYHHRRIWKDPKAARFMWGEENPEMSSLDRMQKILQKKEFQYSICPIRYSIGFILFHRENWVRMGTFPVLEYRNMGADEEGLCQFCMMQARAMVIAENAVVGHLSYGPQNREMEEYYHSQKEKFGCNSADLHRRCLSKKSIC